MRTRSTLITASLSVLMSVCAASASAATFSPVLDEFWILKGGPGVALTEIFRDSFDSGGPPPEGPDGAGTYAVSGPGGITSEAAGKLTMTPVLGDPVFITTTFADLSTGGVRQLATNPANANFLGQASAFEIHGLYDLTNLPTIPGQSFGIHATDRAVGIGNQGNNTYSLFAGVNPNTLERHVTLRLLDYTQGTSIVLGSSAIESFLPGADQIEFIFSKTAGDDFLTASYRLYDYDLTNSLVDERSIGSQSTLGIYDGEAYLRARFEATDRVPVPEPATLALLGLGIAGLALARKRSDASR